MTQTTLFGPVIAKRQPALKGRDNEGIGFTQFGEQYLLKLPPEVCLAEFVGTRLCEVAGIPTCQATVVSYKGKPVFGGRFEAGLEKPTVDDDYLRLIRSCATPAIFSGVLALDLVLGNNDRHWDNWLYQRNANGTVQLRAIDFSRAWPTAHPPSTFASMASENTRKAYDLWQAVGVTLQQTAFDAVCATLRGLPPDWMAQLCEPLPDEWKHNPDVPSLCDWFSQEWANRIDDVQDFMLNGAWI